MAQSRGNQNQWSNNAIFADINLVEQDKAAFSKYLTTKAADFGETLQFVCDEEYRVTLKWDEKNDAYTCSWTQQNPKHKNAGIILTSFAEDPETAFFMNCYKCYELYPDDSLPVRGENSTRWG